MLSFDILCSPYYLRRLRKNALEKWLIRVRDKIVMDNIFKQERARGGGKKCHRETFHSCLNRTTAVYRYI